MKSVAPKFLYYIGLIVPSASLIVFIYVFLQLFNRDQLEPMLLIALFNSLLTVWLIFYLRKFIYFETNEDHGFALFGNLFMAKKIHISEVDSISSTLIFKRLKKVKIADATYLMLTQ